MRLLLIDNSNTRTKFAVVDSVDAPLEAQHIATTDVCPSFIKTLGELDFEAVVLSSVVPEKANLFREVLSPAPLHEISCRSDLPIDIAYPEPGQIGAARLANAVAAHARVGAPAIVVDFGTAVTFDVLGGTRTEGSYLGGVIAPGLPSMTDYLHQSTALLPEIDLQDASSAIGKSTTEAMRSGAVHGYRGMVRGVLRAIRNELDETPTVIATGGDASLIAAGLPEIMEVVQNLTLRGIYLIGMRNLA